MLDFIFKKPYTLNIIYTKTKKVPQKNKSSTNSY